MATYWVTFRLKDDATYSDRYDKLSKVIDQLCDGWWVEPTSFFLFECDDTIDTIAGKVKAAINTRTDVVLISMPHVKAARIVGTPDYGDTLRSLLPFAKAA
jgi:hypothetical protein